MVWSVMVHSAKGYFPRLTLGYGVGIDVVGVVVGGRGGGTVVPEGCVVVPVVGQPYLQVVIVTVEVDCVVE